MIKRLAARYSLVIGIVTGFALRGPCLASCQHTPRCHAKESRLMKTNLEWYAFRAARLRRSRSSYSRIYVIPIAKF